MAGGAAVLVDPLDVDSIAAGIAEADARRDEGRGAQARGRRPTAGVQSRTRSSWPGGGNRVKPLVVVDADVLGRERTDDETYVLNLLPSCLRWLRRQGFQFAAVTRRIDLVPAGIEPIELATPSRELRMTLMLPRLLRGLGAALGHFQYALPLVLPCQPSSRSTTSRSSASRR